MAYVDHSEHFSRDELKCKFTGECSMSSSFLTKLETLRTHYGKPIYISSAFRHENHPAEKAKKAKNKKGYHVLGRAVDIKCWNSDGAHLLQIAIQLNLFGGYGFQFTGANRFLHLDDREELMIWSY